MIIPALAPAGGCRGIHDLSSGPLRYHFTRWSGVCGQSIKQVFTRQLVKGGLSGPIVKTAPDWQLLASYTRSRLLPGPSSSIGHTAPCAILLAPPLIV